MTHSLPLSRVPRVQLALILAVKKKIFWWKLKLLNGHYDYHPQEGQPEHPPPALVRGQGGW